MWWRGNLCQARARREGEAEFVEFSEIKSFRKFFGNGSQGDQFGFVAGVFDDFANQINGAEFGIHGVRNRGVGEVIEDGTMLNGPFKAHADGFQEILEFPATIAEGADVADWAHGNFDEAGGIDEWLR